MTTDELMPSPMKTGFDSDDKSRPRRIGATRRPYAMTCHGTSDTVEIRPNAAIAIPTNVAASASARRAQDASATIEAAAAIAMSNCWHARVPSAGMNARLNSNAPAIAPAVFAA